MTNSNIRPLWERQNLRVNNLIENEEFELTEWESKFLSSCHAQQINNQRELSEKQLAIVEKLEGYVINGRPAR